MHGKVLQIFLVVNGLWYFSAYAIVVEKVSSAAWDGVGFYVSVSRDAIQKKLDLYHTSMSSECAEGKRINLMKIYWLSCKIRKIHLHQKYNSGTMYASMYVECFITLLCYEIKNAYSSIVSKSSYSVFQLRFHFIKVSFRFKFRCRNVLIILYSLYGTNVMSNRCYMKV